MTIDRIISLISTVALVYFAYGTWRIERTLTKVERHLEEQGQATQEIRDIMVEIKREDL